MEKKCNYCNSTFIVRSIKERKKYYCNKHYLQIRRHGKIKPSNREPNKIILKRHHAEIILNDIKGNEKNRALIDLGDVEKIKKYKWCGSINCVSTRHKRLHRFIMNCPANKIVDHKNRNPFDNRKCNLRICTHAENLRNRKEQRNNTSGFRGTHFAKRIHKWVAYIKVNNVMKNLGVFKNQTDAINARVDAEKKYFKEFRPI